MPLAGQLTLYAFQIDGGITNKFQKPLKRQQLPPEFLTLKH